MINLLDRVYYLWKRWYFELAEEKAEEALSES